MPVGNSSASPGISRRRLAVDLQPTPADADRVERRARAEGQLQAPRILRAHMRQERATHPHHVENVSERIHPGSPWS
jgi:hypothetical protein